LDPQSGYLAAPGCPDPREGVFIAGTQPTEYCPLHGPPPAGGVMAAAVPVEGLPQVAAPVTPGAQPGSEHRKADGAPGADPQQPANIGPVAKKKKNLLDKIFGIFGGSKKSADPPSTPNPGPNP
jgi:hypothetical protein